MLRISQQQLAALLATAACAVLMVSGVSAHEGSISVVSWASLDPNAAVAPNSAAVVDGEFAERTIKAPDGVPQSELDSFIVEIEGSDDVKRRSNIYAVEPRRIVILIPDLPDGTAHIRVERDGVDVADGEFEVQSVSPGLFSAAASGGGLAAAVAVRVDLADGTRTTEDVAFFNEERGAYEPILLNPAVEGSELYLELLGTGIRNSGALEVEIGGVSVPATLCVGPGPSPGIDQIVVGPLPVELARREVVDIDLTADGIEANAVQVAFSPAAGPAITFSNQIVRLFQGRCQTCHRPGEVAPFSLLDYESAKPWAQAIKQETQSRFMPPWKAIPGHGEFVGERYLSDAEIDVIARWVDAGAPEGDSEDLPEPLEFDPDWSLGQPDLVLEAPAYVPAASQSDDYRCFSIALPEHITTPQSITGIEVRPGNRQIVHHVLLFGDPQGESLGHEQATTDGKPGYECFGSARIGLGGFILGVESYILGGWAPGVRPLTLTEGSGFYLRPGSRLAIQVHYHPDGSSVADSTRIGLHFSDELTPKNSIVLAAINTDFLIPAGEERYEVRAETSLESIAGSNLSAALKTTLTALGVFPLDVTAVAPHMHLLGREIRMDKVSPSGERTPMILINDWDFDWQSFYTYVEPVPLDIDDRLEVLSIYDNSENNPRNPNSPPQPVGWGDRTTDEMCIVFFQVDIPSLCAFGLCGN